MFKFGFELEGFYIKDGVVDLPPRNYPTDGFPGLCEVRTSGGKPLDEAYFELLRLYAKTPFSVQQHEHVFTPAQKRAIRARLNSKDAVEISNIYGKEPRALGNRTLASLQINISYMLSSEYRDDRGVLHPAQYGLFDFRPIIERLDKEFAEEIKTSGRQPGFYAVKDSVRVEYRSLPNTVVDMQITTAQLFIERIRKCHIKEN